MRAALGCSAQGIQDALMADIREFVNDAPQSDDIALAAIVREAMDNFSPGQVTRYVPRLGER